ncbi:MAG: hypothetical protein ACRDWY_18085, partial [Actinomycetes bacterium]
DPRYTLDADLPDGPAEAPVHRLRGVDSDAVAQLAGALGLDGVPAAEAGAQRWSNDRAELSVQDSGQWSYAVVAQESMAEQTTMEQALDAAGQLFADAGLATEDFAVRQDGASGMVTADPVVDGLPTGGYGVTVVIRGSAIVSAQGWLAETAAGPSYPLVSAQDAWEAFVRTPSPVALMACPEPVPGSDNQVACGGGPVTVTGAELGLSLQWAGTEPLLVPSWLFDVDGSRQRLAQVAVEPRYLHRSDEVPPAAPGGGEPGSSGTAAPPVAPSTDPGGDERMSRFASVKRSGDDMSLDVTFWGGVEDCYDYTVRVEESDEAVRLRLSEKATFDGACIELAQQYDRRVPLERALGVRHVVDADTGETLLGPTR